MELRIPRRRLVAVTLALIFAAETVGVVAASFPGQPAAEPALVQVLVGDVLAAEATPEVPAAALAVESRVSAPRRDVASVAGTASVTAPEPAATPDQAPGAAPKATSKPKPNVGTVPALHAKPVLKAAATAKPSKGTAKGSSSGGLRTAADFAGRNHVWIPALGISKSVRAFSCERNRPPDNFMYRWGCAGANNIYLMGHAYSVMKPLHDAYVGGRLSKGMKAFYAGANGKVHVFAVKYWKVVLPTPDAAWAWAAQGRSSMTLQTCVGKNSKYRLIVRMVEVNG